MADHRGYPIPRGAWDPPPKSKAKTTKGKGLTKGKSSNPAKKVIIGDHEFDSAEEGRFYIVLTRDPNVVSIDLQPVYQLVPDYFVQCARCRGAGKLENPKTGNMNQCGLCKGKGKRKKAGVVYNADFRVTYQGGYSETIDVKPSITGKSYKYTSPGPFPIKKRMFEAATGETLIIVRENGSMNFEREDK